MKTNEKFVLKTKEYKYITLNQLDEEEQKTDELTDDFSKILSSDSVRITKTISNLSLHDINESTNTELLIKNQNKDEVLVRRCDTSCIIPENWALKIHNSLQKLDPTKNFHDLQREILEIEYCKRF